MCVTTPIRRNYGFKHGFKNKASYAHVARRRKCPRASPARRRARDPTLRDIAPTRGRRGGGGGGYFINLFIFTWAWLSWRHEERSARVCRVFENGAVAICKYNFFKLVFLLIQASSCVWKEKCDCDVSFCRGKWIFIAVEKSSVEEF